MKEFVTFKKFNDPALAEDLVVLLKSNGISYQVEEDALSFKPYFNNNDELDREYLIKISPADFDQANKVLNEAEADNIAQVNSDHYLFAFTDAELMDVVIKTDEWSNFDQLLARRILIERDVNITDQQVSEAKQVHIQALKKPEHNTTLFIIAGYVMVLVFSFIGIFIGWVLRYSKKTLPNGERVYMYKDADRKQGSIIFTLSIISAIVLAALRIYKAA
ncbi:hypothetical protein LJ707_18900 [Mucilaginibacter sp. UR6-1]|uniref:hypothetical protein n=1 Tax=Mucilaginibacter sp. UR6-1 TaxID=1435643 RepID=UPI001E35B1E0|nr:hypothetical protein [Mucilaginibacter sp. UR6-1]MCC8411016.1 hypothetical protein [Mucilaginibacter sp. UR6-1]